MNRLSIIVQGPVMGPDGEPDMRVIRNLRRTRAAFPLAEIILSTWQAPLATVERLEAQAFRVGCPSGHESGSGAAHWGRYGR